MIKKKISGFHQLFELDAALKLKESYDYILPHSIFKFIVHAYPSSGLYGTKLLIFFRVSYNTIGCIRIIISRCTEGRPITLKNKKKTVNKPFIQNADLLNVKAVLCYAQL